MAGGGKTVDRLREFLRGLTSEARSKLIAELERKMLRGEQDPATDLILNELRRLFRESRETSPRDGNGARIFFKPLEPFIVDDAPSRRHPGRIARGALGQLWSFIERDLLPDEAKRYCEAAASALSAGDEGRAELAARSFQDAVVAALERALSGGDDRERRRRLAQIGTPRAEEDAVNLMHILKLRDSLAMLGEHLPGYIASLSDKRLTETKSLIASATARSPEIAPYALLMVMRRLNEFWQLIRLAAPGPKGAVDTAYGGAVSMVLAELARLIEEMRGALTGNGVAIAALLQSIHNAARGLRTELDPSPDSACGRELAALRRQISELLHAELQQTPGRVRRLLKPRPASEIKANSALDPIEVADTEAAIMLVAACRNFAGELALNEVTQRSYSEVQQYLEDGTDPLLDALRKAGEGDRKFRQSQADAAVRFCGKLFGPDYAAMLTRATEVAAAAERKPQPVGA